MLTEISIPDEGDRVLCMFQDEQTNNSFILEANERKLCMVQASNMCNKCYNSDVAYILQKRLLDPKKEEESQRHEIFKTVCTNPR